MPNQDYTSEIKDAFGEKIDTKEALKIAKTIKSTHKLAYPKKEFKNILKWRLQESYFISQADEVPSRFSIFQIIWVFGSFIFIVWALTTVYNIRETPQAVLLQEKVLQDSRVSEDFTTPDVYEDDNVEVRSIEQIEGISEVPDDIEEVPYLDSKAQFIAPQKKQELPQTVPGTSETILESLEDTIIPGSLWDQEVQTFPQESISEFSEDILPASSSSMFFIETNDSEQQESEISFFEICWEYGWEIDLELNTCTLPSGTVCEKGDIYECVLQDIPIDTDLKVDIFLEEPKEESGQ